AGPAPAPDDRPRAPQEPADPDLGRGDLRARFGVGEARPGSARSVDEKPDQSRDRPSLGDGAARRPDPRHGAWAGRRNRDPPRATRTRRPLRPLPRAADAVK